MPSREEIEMSTRLILETEDRERYETILALISTAPSRGQRRALEKERNHIEELARTTRAMEAANAKEIRRQVGASGGGIGDTIRKILGFE